MRMKIKCTGELEGNTITGKAKSRIFTLPFVANRMSD